MKHSTNVLTKVTAALPTYASLVMALVAVFASPMVFAFTSGSTDADGAFNPTANVEVPLPPSGILNYTTINIPSGVTVTFKKNTANTPVYLLASGNVTIAGKISLVGEDAKPTGTFGDGALGDDGIPGAGGPGGFDGGRGGREDAAQTPAIIRGGAGLGPGGGKGGIEGGDGSCPVGYGYYAYVGGGAGYAKTSYQPWAVSNCGGVTAANISGKSYGSALLQPIVGGSGGGGGRGGVTYPGSGGGGGGGAILIASSGTLQVSGSIDATGGDAGGIAGTGGGGQGAGGSGGAIRLVATTITGNGSLLANGGCITNSGGRRQSCGYAGGGEQGGSEGRIRLEATAITFNGTSQPTYVADQPGPVFIAGSPSLRIASVAGTSVPANPTGIADVTLPASTTGPVVVTFETTNVPVGNTVLLRLVPAYGKSTEALSPAITGSTATGATQVSITLPQGPSTLQATTTYTVVVAMNEGDALSRFAQNERVEKVEVTVALQGGTRAKLITVSGKTYELPYEALSAAGFQG